MFEPSIGMFVAIAVAFILGYVARKFVEKKWPDEAHRLDEKAQYYGQVARDRVDAVRDDIRDNLKK